MGRRARGGQGGRDGDRQGLRQRRQPAARQRPLGGEVLDARHDGHGPQPRPERADAPRADRPDRQRALRLGRLPAVHPDVRPDRDGRRRRALRPCARGGEGGPRRRPGHRPLEPPPCARPSPRTSRRSSRPTPAATSRADPYEQLDLAIKAVFATWFGKRARDYRDNQQDRPRPGHGGQRRDDGLRQHGRRLGHGRRLHPRPEHRREGPLRRVPDQRPGRGRRGRHPDAAADQPDGRRHARGLRRVPADRPAPRAPLPRRPGPRVHDRARPAVHAPDALGQADRGRGRARSPPTWSTRASSAERRGAGADRAGACRPAAARPVRPGGPGEAPRGSPRASTRRLAPRSAGPCSMPTSPSSGSSSGEKVVLVRIETSPDDFHGMAVAQGILTARGGATSHAAVVARQIGKPCVAGCARARHRLRREDGASANGVELRGGGLDQRSTARPARSSSARCRPSRPGSRTSPSSRRILGWADEVRRMQVWTNADKPEEAALARQLRRAGHRPVPHRAHVPRGRAARDRARRDPRRERRHAGQGEGRRRRGAVGRRDRGRHPLRCGDGQARGPPAGRLRGHLQGDGRAAGRRPAHRPAAPRVPARTSRSSSSR